MNPLRSEDECIEHIKRCIYNLPARLRKIWKPVWQHLYQGKTK